MHSFEINYPQPENKMEKKEEKKKEESECVWCLRTLPSRELWALSEVAGSLCSRCPLLATVWPLGPPKIPPGKCSWSQIWPQDFFHYPPTFPFTSNLRQGPGFPFGAGIIKTWGHPGWPGGPFCQSLLPHLCSLSHQAAGPIAVNQVTTPRQ